MEEDGDRTNFVTNGWSVFTELDAEWKPTKRLVRGYGIVASEECGQVVEESITTEPIAFNRYHFYHQNEHGDTEYITGRDGKVKNAYTYDAFGNITNAEELVKNRYTYNGEQYDQIAQQYYLRARNYNPLIGRFTQEDVYRGDGLNLYAYCGNNPMMYVDPSRYYKASDDVFDLSSVGKKATSSDLKAAMLEDMTGVNRTTTIKMKAGSHQAQHIIPREYVNHPVIKGTGYQVDHAENGIFAINQKSITPNALDNSIKPYNVSSDKIGKYVSNTTQHGTDGKTSFYHEAYSEYVGKILDEIGENYGLKQGMSDSEFTKQITNLENNGKIKDLKSDIMSLNQDLRKSHQDGIDLY